MNKMKWIGIGLILLGLITAMEGIGLMIGGSTFNSIIANEIASIEYFASFEEEDLLLEEGMLISSEELNANLEAMQGMQAIVSLVIIYSLIKTIIAIALIAIGATIVFEKKNKGQDS